MNSLRIAICGPDMQMNEWAKEQVGFLIHSFNDSISYINNPLAAIMEKTRKQDWSEQIDEMNLYTNVWRAIEQLRYEDEDILIASSCGIDCVALQAAWLAEQAVLLEQKSSLLGADGKAVLSREHVLFNKSGAILQTILNQAEQEAVEYWDFIYAVIPPASALLQHTNDVLAQYEDFLDSVPAFSKVIKLPNNKTAALDALQQEVTKWKTHIDLSS